MSAGQQQGGAAGANSQIVTATASSPMVTATENNSVDLI